MSFNSYIIQNIELSCTLPIDSHTYAKTKENNISKYLEKAEKLGFTLAEVLITLTIIGVIAAMTVPTLISNYQKNTYVAGFKKAYSTLSNALKILPLERGCPAGDFDCVGLFDEPTQIDDKEFTSRNYAFPYLLSKVLKTQKICLGNFLDCTNGVYKNTYTLHNAGFGQLILEDGMLIGSWGSHPFFVEVDINGTKGPNKNGRDVFLFYITANNESNIPQGSVLPYGSQIAHQYWGGVVDPPWNVTKACTTAAADSNSFAAHSCAGRVFEEDAMNY